MGFSRKKTPVKDINGKFQGSKVKVVGISGSTLKIAEKTWIYGGINAKK